MTQCLRLVDRLRGIYVLPVNDGLGLLDGKDTFTRDFSKEHNSPLEWIVAANLIERLDAGELISRGIIQETMSKLVEKKDWLGLGLEPYQAPIGLEAYDYLEDYLN